MCLFGSTTLHIHVIKFQEKFRYILFFRFIHKAIWSIKLSSKVYSENKVYEQEINRNVQEEFFNHLYFKLEFEIIVVY